MLKSRRHLEQAKPHLLYIDCVRGYAVLMVVTVHLAYQYPGLPYPIHRLVTTGWYGVQLFFLASCTTLLMSWNFEAAKHRNPSIINFFVRRFFRIAPAYYAAGIFYFYLWPPVGGFDLWQAMASALFINAWSPSWTSTVTNGWSVVPGGWSIGVEVTFYLLFPFYATWMVSMRRAFASVIITIVIGVIANIIALSTLLGIYLPQEIDNFLFFWFPNQMSVFALGGVLYFLLQQPGWRTLSPTNATLFQFGAIASFCVGAYLPLGHYLGAAPYIPASLAVTLPLIALVLVLSSGRGLLVNRFAAAMGRASFSAYLLHFSVVQAFETFRETLHTHEIGLWAIPAFAIGWAIAVSATFAVSWASYRAIELPMIAAGKMLIRSRSQRRGGRPTLGPATSA